MNEDEEIKELKKYLEKIKLEAIERKGSSKEEWAEKSLFFVRCFYKMMLSRYEDLWAKKFQYYKSGDDNNPLKKLEGSFLKLPWIEAFLGHDEDHIIKTVPKIKDIYKNFPPNVIQFESFLNDKYEISDPMFENFEPLKKRED